MAWTSALPATTRSAWPEKSFTAVAGPTAPKTTWTSSIFNGELLPHRCPQRPALEPVFCWVAKGQCQQFRDHRQRPITNHHSLITLPCLSPITSYFSLLT